MLQTDEVRAFASISKIFPQNFRQFFCKKKFPLSYEAGFWRTPGQILRILRSPQTHAARGDFTRQTFFFFSDTCFTLISYSLFKAVTRFFQLWLYKVFFGLFGGFSHRYGNFFFLMMRHAQNFFLNKMIVWLLCMVCDFIFFGGCSHRCGNFFFFMMRHAQKKCFFLTTVKLLCMVCVVYVFWWL